jgi:integrase
LLQLCLLTAQRVTKVRTLKWSDIDGDEWIIATAEREKSNAFALVLPDVALDIINRQPRMMSNDHVFSGRRGKAMTIATMRYRLAPKLPKIEAWTIHDLRRTARSLMSRAGVRPDIAERVLGHAIEGIEKIYDRHSYRDEKSAALRRLSVLIDTIVREDRKVIPLTGKKVSGTR